MAIIFLVCQDYFLVVLFQGGEQKPLTLVGPKGIKAYVEMSMNLSESHLNYPITYIEIDDHLTYHHDGFTVEAHLLNHGIPSYGYRVMAPETTGTINVEALKTLVLNQVLNIKK